MCLLFKIYFIRNNKIIYSNRKTSRYIYICLLSQLEFFLYCPDMTYLEITVVIALDSYETFSVLIVYVFTV